MSAAANKKSILCKFQNQDYCKVKEKCYFRHVENVCHDKKCDQIDCLKRHLKLCKYRKCKFKEKCEFSHEGVNNETNDEYETLKANLKDLEIANTKLTDENSRRMRKFWKSQTQNQ